MVNGIGHGQNYQVAIARFNSGVRGPEGGGKHESKVQGDQDQGHPHGRAHGALRNLQAGHYQGMAGLRLSINFSAEIQAQVADEEQSATSAAAASFKEQATGIINEFVDGLPEGEFDLEVVNAAAEEFFAAVDELGESASTLEALKAGLSDAVEAFSTALSDAIAVARPADTSEATGTGDAGEIGVADAPEASLLTEPSDPAPVHSVGETSSVDETGEVPAPEDPFAQLTQLIEDLANSLMELAQSILSDAGAGLDSFKLSFEASLVTVSSSTASASYSQVSLSFETSSTETSGLELAA